MITNEKPDVSPTGRYFTKQTAKALGIHISTLRRYTRDGLIKCGHSKIPTPHNYYLGKDIIKLWRQTYSS